MLFLAALHELHSNAGGKVFIVYAAVQVLRPIGLRRCPFKLLFSFCSNLNILCFAADRIVEMMDCAYHTVSRSKNDRFPHTLIT